MAKFTQFYDNNKQDQQCQPLLTTTMTHITTLTITTQQLTNTTNILQPPQSLTQST